MLASSDGACDFDEIKIAGIMTARKHFSKHQLASKRIWDGSERDEMALARKLY